MPGSRSVRRALLAALLVLCAAPQGAAAITVRPCAGQPGFDCGVLRVPLDRTGAVPGTIGLRVAIERRRARGVLVALTGGPGQAGVLAASQFRQTLAPLRRSRRLVVLDQRGTGASGALDCPAVQRLTAFDVLSPEAVGACAARIGPRRRSFTTQDTVADLEALRRELRAPKLALMGVSYGTFVAQQYARTHPARTERLLLDSVVSPGGVDPFLLDTFSRLPRVLRDQCARRACAGVTDDPVADLGALLARLDAGDVAGRVFDARGRARAARLSSGEQALSVLVAADLNPFLQAALPGAMAAARAGDDAPLLRLRAVAAGAPLARRELSAGLNVATSCQDVRLPYALTAPVEERRARATAALAALPPAAYAPFTAEHVRRSGYSEACLGWPDGGAVPSTAPLPDVPTLLLAGRLDLRTPRENGDALAAELPRVQRLDVAGTGHDVLDSDVTGCVARAVDRWARGRALGSPCAGRSNAVVVLPTPPQGVDAYLAPPGVPGARGRVLFAALDTLQDAPVTFFQRVLAGFSGRAGGLRGGSFSVVGALEGVRLRDYSYVPGVRLSGTVRFTSRGNVGRVTVRGPRGTSGVLTVRGPRLSGRLGGRAVSYRASDARAARSARGAPRIALEPGLVRAALQRARALRRGR